MWIGNIIDALGYDWTKYPCRGEIGDWEMSDDVLVIYQRTAWHEQEGFREVIQKKFPNLIVYFQDQDLFFGGYCATNSFDEFPDRYVLLNDDGQYYFQTIEEAAKYVSDIVGYVVEDSEEAIDIALDKYMSAMDTNEGYQVFLSFRLLNTTPSADAPE